MLSDQLKGTQRVTVRGLNGVDLERNIGDAGQHAVPRQRRLYMFDIADVGIQLRQMIGDSVTDYFMPGGAMRRRLLA
jgi:hypothetical protein